MHLCDISFLLALCLTIGSHSSAAVEIILPTDNDALFRGKPEEFYMYVNRWTGGVKSTPWEGGQYGFVRTPKQTPAGLVYTRFHGGIDVRPLYRDHKGNPVDQIHAIAQGRVVHTNPDSRGSNYGRYLVIEHQWDGCPYYSLYAHLSDIYVKVGQEVTQGEKIGMMGYTGRGIDRERAHLHLEVTLMLNSQFDGFYNSVWGEGNNRHGNFNGINLCAIDVARLYQETRANPKLTIPEFLEKEEVFFHADLPGNYPLDLLERYPWMLAGEAGKSGDAPPAGWRIAFSQTGIPLRVERLDEVVPEIRVVVRKVTEFPLPMVTRGLLTLKEGQPELTNQGERFVGLLTHRAEPHENPIAAGTQLSTRPATRGEKTHMVKKGDTLIGIASEYNIEVPELQNANGIKDPKLLQIGQVLVIPVTKPTAKQTRQETGG